MSYPVGTKFTYTSPDAKKYSAEVIENDIIKTITTPGTRMKKEYPSVQEWLKSISETLVISNPSLVIKEPKVNKSKKAIEAEKRYGKCIIDGLAPSVKKLAIAIYEVIEEGNKDLFLNDAVVNAFNDFISYVNENNTKLHIHPLNNNSKYMGFKIHLYLEFKTNYLSLAHYLYYDTNPDNKRHTLSTQIGSKFTELYNLVYPHIADFINDKLKSIENAKRIPVLKRYIKSTTEKIAELQDALVAYQEELDELLPKD